MPEGPFCQIGDHIYASLVEIEPPVRKISVETADFFYISLCKICDTRAGPFLAPGAQFEQTW